MWAFEAGDKQDAERLLPQIQQPADIRTTTFLFFVWCTEQVSLLHMATHHGWMDIIIDLITKYKCDTNCKESHGRTPLHYAVINNHLEVVRYFINEQHCDPMTRDTDGNTPLHYAVIYNHLEVVKYFINEQHCDPMTRDNDGNTPLHYACQHDRLLIVQYLISEVSCDPSCENKYNDTPLHYACIYNHPQIAQFLLSTGKVDPLAENNKGKSPLDYASEHGKSYDLLKLFHSFPQCERDFAVHTYTKLILTGYSGAGKTTISQLILLLASKPETGLFSWLSSGRVTDVECLTAGIIPLHVESKVNEVGNMVIYDFAGQQEYYSSHAAVLERIMRNSAAIFVCIVDLSQCMDKISESIHYWISFIENACSSAQGSSHVIIVGSHADLVKSSRELKEKSSLVESIAESRVKQLTYGRFVSMDCRLSKNKEARHFRSLLSTSQQAILSSQPSMSLYCHVLYAFLRTKLMKVGCTLH